MKTSWYIKNVSNKRVQLLHLTYDDESKDLEIMDAETNSKIVLFVENLKEFKDQFDKISGLISKIDPSNDNKNSKYSEYIKKVRLKYSNAYKPWTKENDNKLKKINKKIHTMSENDSIMDKGEYKHFMLKEIYEQPDVILKAGKTTVEGIEDAAVLIKNAKNIYITGSGTSYNSALIAKQILSKYVKIKAEPIIASELQFAPDTIEENSVLIAISQSGESADV